MTLSFLSTVTGRLIPPSTAAVSCFPLYFLSLPTGDESFHRDSGRAHGRRGYSADRHRASTIGYKCTQAGHQLAAPVSPRVCLPIRSSSTNTHWSCGFCEASRPLPACHLPLTPVSPPRLCGHLGNAAAVFLLPYYRILPPSRMKERMTPLPGQALRY